MSSGKEKRRKFVELLKKREKLEGIKVVNTILNLATSNYTVNRNYQELSNAISKYEKDSSIWDIQNRHQLDAFMREFSRLLQNYLSSIYSLIEHTYIVRKDLSRFESSEEYSSKLSALNDKNCLRFVKDLRTYSQHIRLPIISTNLSISKNKETGKNKIEQKILLQKEEMMKWKKWHKDSTKYIDSHKEIDLKLVLVEYQALINDFYDWFYKEVGNLYAKEFGELTKIETKLASLAP